MTRLKSLPGVPYVLHFEAQGLDGRAVLTVAEDDANVMLTVASAAGVVVDVAFSAEQAGELAEAMLEAADRARGLTLFGPEV